MGGGISVSTFEIAIRSVNNLRLARHSSLRLSTSLKNGYGSDNYTDC